PTGAIHEEIQAKHGDGRLLPRLRTALKCKLTSSLIHDSVHDPARPAEQPETDCEIADRHDAEGPQLEFGCRTREPGYALPPPAEPADHGQDRARQPDQSMRNEDQAADFDENLRKISRVHGRLLRGVMGE